MPQLRDELQQSVDRGAPPDGTSRRLAALEVAFAHVARSYGLTAAECEHAADGAQTAELFALRALAPITARLERIGASATHEESVLVARCFRAGEAAMEAALMMCNSRPANKRHEAFSAALKDARTVLGVTAAQLRSAMSLRQRSIAQAWAGQADTEQRDRLVRAQRARDSRGVQPALRKPGAPRKEVLLEL